LAAKAIHPLAPLVASAIRLPMVRKLSARMSGLAIQREMVLFARRSLYQRLPDKMPGQGPCVLYFAGCYAAYIRPRVGQATVAVLSRAGFHVHLPRQYCCGLPQLSKGMAADARHKIRQNLRAWQKTLAKVDYIVVSCSSCGFALMKDWSYLINDPPLVSRIRDKTIHISHLLNAYRDQLMLKEVPAKVAYHHPCHLRIQSHGDSSIALLSAIPGVEVRQLRSQCCGMAGSWGMMAKNYALSKAIGTSLAQRLNASGAQYGVTDCPTCRIQMEHLGNLPVRHPIEVVHAAIAQH
jgi:Fe-S oxidoreductase